MGKTSSHRPGDLGGGPELKGRDRKPKRVRDRTVSDTHTWTDHPPSSPFERPRRKICREDQKPDSLKRSRLEITGHSV